MDSKKDGALPTAISKRSEHMNTKESISRIRTTVKHKQLKVTRIEGKRKEAEHGVTL